MTTPSDVDREAPVLAHHETIIQAPLAAVWDLHTDVNAWTTWQTDITAAHIDGRMQPGTSFDWSSYGFPVTSTVYEIVERHRVLWGGTAGGITGIHEWLFEDTPNGTRVTTTESFAGDPVAADREGMQGMLDASLVAWLAHMKAAAEAR
jgi:uncharacterized protein YndB with AHSA1/START domain